MAIGTRQPGWLSFRQVRILPLPTLTLALLLVAVTWFAPPSSPASSLEDDIARIQIAYESLKDIKGSFAQKSYIKDLKRTEVFRGEFFMKPGKVKWEYKGDKPQVIYVTGDEMVVYQKKEKQAIKTRFDRSAYGQTPLALLAGFGKIKEEFTIIKKHERLLLTPKRPMGSIVAVELSLAAEEFPIDSLTIVDTAYNRIDIQLRDVMMNTGLSDRVFVFTPPEGVTVVQQ